MHPACHPNLVQSQLHAHVLQRMNGLPRLPPSLSRLPPQCAKVRVSQPRLYGCLLHRHPRRESAAEPHHPTPLHTHPPRTPPSSTAHTAWNAGFSRHPRRDSAAEPHHPTLLHSHLPGPHPPAQPTRLGTPASAGTRGARAQRNRHRYRASRRPRYGNARPPVGTRCARAQRNWIWLPVLRGPHGWRRRPGIPTPPGAPPGSFGTPSGSPGCAGWPLPSFPREAPARPAGRDGAAA